MSIAVVVHHLFFLMLLGFSWCAVGSLPQLLMDGFPWLENLAFDGKGNVFLTDYVIGNLWRVQLCSDGQKYCKYLHLSSGFKKFSGLAISEDGLQIYAGAIMNNGSNAIIVSSTQSASGASERKYDVICLTKGEPLGLAADWERNTIYYTTLGDKQVQGGVTSVNIRTGNQLSVAKISSADGILFDAKSRKLFVGELFSKAIHVFSPSVSGLKKEGGKFAGMGAVGGSGHLLDEFLLESSVDVNNLGSTVFIGTDWMDKKLVRFTLSGNILGTIPAPKGIVFNELTSIRRGKGPGFDTSSIYITEGGGKFATQKDRRIIQIPLIS